MGVESDLRALEAFERRLGEFYAWLSEVFSGDSEAAAIFRKLQQEEKAHANLLQYQRRLFQQNPALFEGVVVGSFDAVPTLVGVETLFAAQTPPILAEAVRTAVAVEQSAAERHSRQAMRMAGGKVSTLLATLAEADQHHARALIELGRSRNYLPSRA